MADEAKEVALVVKSCTKKTGNDGNDYYEIVGSADGVNGTFYGKDDWAVGEHKALRYGEKKNLYKPKPSGGARGSGAPQRNYDIENRQRAVDAAIAFKGGKDWDLHDTLTLADMIAEYYKSGKKPPKKGAQQ